MRSFIAAFLLAQGVMATLSIPNCPETDEVFPVDPDLCTEEYYACLSGVPFLLRCPPNLVFDPIRLSCVKEDQASCNIALPDCPEPYGFFPLPDTCDALHYVCVGSVPNFQVCPGTSIFDPVLLFCVTNGTASCQNVVTTTTTKGPFVCPGDGVFEYAECSSLYFFCSGGSYIIAQCPSGQLFDPETSYCQDASEVEGCSFREHDNTAHSRANQRVSKKLH